MLRRVNVFLKQKESAPARYALFSVPSCSRMFNMAMLYSIPQACNPKAVAMAVNTVMVIWRIFPHTVFLLFVFMVVFFDL